VAPPRVGVERTPPPVTKGSGMAADPRGEGAYRRRHPWDLAGDQHCAAGREEQGAQPEVRGRERRAGGVRHGVVAV